MFRVYVFAQMLKMGKQIETTEFSRELNDSVTWIKLQPYVGMIRDYLSKNWSVPYSIPHMIKEAMYGNVTSGPKCTDPLSIQFEDIIISRIPQRELISIPNVGGPQFRDEYERSIFYDNKFYDSAFDWWVHYKDVLIYEMLFQAGTTGLHITVYFGKRGPIDTPFRGAEDWLYASGVFQWWLFFESGKGLTETYRLHPGPIAGSNVKSCLGEDFDNFVQGRLNEFGVPQQLIDGYVRYTCSKVNFEQYNPARMRTIVYEGGK